MIPSGSVVRVGEPFPGEAFAERYGIGFAVREIRNGVIVRSTAFSGAAAAGPAVTGDSILWLGCISKVLTAAAVLILVDRRELSLDDPVGRFIPGVADDLAAATVEQLLTHTSGLPRNVPEMKSFFCPEWLSQPLRAAVLRTASRVHNPGVRTYSSVGYMLLGAIVEHVAGQEFGALVGREIFAPLGMRDSVCINAIPASHVSRMPPVLVRAAGGVSAAFQPTSAGIVNSMPFAGFFSTTADVERFMQMILGGGCDGRRTLLREETVARMCGEKVFGQGIHQAMGWFLAFPAPHRALAGDVPCGVWHTNSSGSIVIGDRLSGSMVIILGQTLLEHDVIPIRVAEWRYIERTLEMQPMRDSVQPRPDLPGWLQQFRAENADQGA